MRPDALGLPTVIVPYPGPSQVPGVQDIFVYLRPETNGVIAESTILKVVKNANLHGDVMSLVFLANLPGEFIVKHKIVEQFYSLRLHFAVHGANAFTPAMRRQFEAHFKIDLASAAVHGAFDAMDRLQLKPEELFDLWVPEHDLLHMQGQIIKRIHGLFVVNYDIPALIHKNSKQTDIAVMLFRTSFGYEEVNALVQSMHKALCGSGILSSQLDVARAFHYSKSPLAQVLDGIAYLYPILGPQLRIQDLTFAHWLLDQQISIEKLASLLRNPIVMIHDDQGESQEVNLFQYTQFDSYSQSLKKINQIYESQQVIHHGQFITEICATTAAKV
jgi:hypothetical protein